MLGGNVCFPRKETPTSGILCDECFMIIVSSIEREKSFRYYYAYFTTNSSKGLCWSLCLLLNLFSVFPALLCIVETLMVPDLSGQPSLPFLVFAASSKVAVACCFVT